MGGKSVLALDKKIQKDKQKDYEKRREAMMPEINKLSEKYRIDLVAVIQANDQGIYPLIAFVDAKEKYEQQAKEKAASQKGKDTPKLEV